MSETNENKKPLSEILSQLNQYNTVNQNKHKTNKSELKDGEMYIKDFLKKYTMLDTRLDWHIENGSVIVNNIVINDINFIVKYLKDIVRINI